MKLYRIANKSSMIKTAVTDGEFRDLKDKANSIKSDIRDLKKDYRDMETKIRKIEKTIDELNIGKRMFSESKNTFTSLQRKVERLEAVSQEWKNFKSNMESSIKKQVEKHTRARISDVAPKAY